VERRVARESADLRGGRHVSRTAASSAADPTESYAPGKSHEISRCTPPCPASVPNEDDTKCYAWGARVPHASTEKAAWPHPYRPYRYETHANHSVLCGSHEMRDSMEAVALCGVPGA
jgi:hypothetical protein